MKERGILFSAPMVRALLAGEKTQTRRALKLPKYAAKGDLSEAWSDNTSPFGACLKVPVGSGGDGVVERVFCPYGSPGDRLWVRETWTLGRANFKPTKGTSLRGRSGAAQPVLYRANELYNDAAHKWRPSLFMPRWASRITLELTEVRVGRVNEISAADARAEGALHWAREATPEDGEMPVRDDDVGARAWFQSLWQTINTAGPARWMLHPWVWVLTFRMVG